MTLRPILTSRFALVPGAIAAAAFVWSIYADLNAGGLVTGVVTDALGQPAPGAIVTIGERNITSNFVERARVTTDAAGRFRFEENASHMLRLQATGADGARGEPTIVRLWFRAQNVELAEPLRLRSRTP